MKKEKMKSILACTMITIYLCFLIGCTGTTETPEITSPENEVNRTQFPLNVIDQLGRTVALHARPQRIISLAPSNTEILYALGLADNIVGVTKYCDYPPEATEKPNIGGYSTPNIEEVVAKSPDLILATTIHDSKVIPQLEDKGLTIVAIAPKNLDEVLEGIRLVGEVTGKGVEADKLVTEMESRIQTITDKIDQIPEDQRPQVFYLTWHDPLKTSGQGTLNDELMRRAGGRNIFPEVVGTQTVDFETLVARNPQVMIAGIGMGTGEDKTLQFLQTEPRLQDTDAAIQGRIYGIDMDITGRAGPRIIDGLEDYAKCIHPDLFGKPD